MASFPTACQSGDLRAGRQAGRSAGACGLTCAPCGSPGSAGSTPASTTRTTARNSRRVPDEHRTFRTNTHKPAPVMVLAAISPVGKSPLVFVYPRAWKSTRKPISRPEHTWAGAEGGWGYPRRESPDIPAGRGELEEFWPHRTSIKNDAKNIPFHHHQGPVAPIIDRSESNGLLNVVCAWERSLLQAAQKIWSVNDRRSQKQSCVPPSETS